MRKKGKVIMWILSGFMAMSAMAVMPSLASVFMLLFAVVAAPVKPLQEMLAEKNIAGPLKGILLTVLFFVSVMLSPTGSTSSDPSGNGSDSSLRIQPVESSSPTRGFSEVHKDEEPTDNPSAEVSFSVVMDDGPQETPLSPMPVAENPAVSSTPSPPVAPSPSATPSPPVAPSPSATPSPSVAPSPSVSQSSEQGGGGGMRPAEDTTEITGALTQTAYWTKGGKSYHFSRNCRSLARSKNILQGTLQDALNAGKLDPCNICAGGS